MKYLVLVALLVACKSDPPAPTPTPVTVDKPLADDPWNAPPKKLPAPTGDEPFARPMLWTATKDGKTMYLFGSLHAGVDIARRLPLWAWKKFDAAKAFVMEVDLHAYASSKWATPPSEARSLKDALGPDDWARLVRATGPVNATYLEHGQTSAAYLAVSGYGARIPDPQAIGMDGELLVRAKEQAKEIVYLETVDDHGALFGTLYDLDALRSLLGSYEQLEQPNRRFFHEYIAGNADSFYDLSTAAIVLGASAEKGAARLEGLLFARNRAWIPQLEAVHAKQPTGGVFVTVGALHLIGPDSVPVLLEKRGFTVSRATTE